MFEWICFLIGIFCLVMAITLATKNRYDTKKWTSFVLAGFLFTTLLFVLPTVPTKWNNNVALDIVYRVITSLLYSLKAIGGRQDLSQIEAFAFTGALKYTYVFICYTMFLIAPFLTTTWLISFFGDFADKIRYVLHFSKNSYIFSELNENALYIARGIKKSDSRAAIVFCDAKKAAESLLIQSRKIGGMCFYKSCVNFNAGWFHRCYNFYLVSDNENKNIRQTSQIIEKHNLYTKKHKNDKIIVNAFAQSGTSIDIIENINQKNIKVRFIDHIAFLCNQLVFKHPLYNIPSGSKDISVMIIGCGRTGMQMLKTVVWAGQIDKYTLKIRAYDKNEKVKERFFSQAPELRSSEYDIDFVTADILSENFEEKISENLDATYVFIATDDDDLNLEIAVKIRGIFRRNTGRYNTCPPILARVRDEYKALNFKDNSYLDDRNIIAFGNASDLFESGIPFETKFEKLSLGVHLAYEEKIALAPTDPEYIEACNRFYCEEYNRRASMATALHIAAKLVSCDIMKYDEYDLSDKIAKEFEEQKLNDKVCIDNLAKNEHKRWNAFYRSEGYRSADINQVKLYAPIVKSHKDKLSKMHPCITEWSNLVELKNEYNSFMEENKDFQEYDYKIVKSIPSIIRFANKSNGASTMCNPKPSIKSNIVLPEELLELTEKIAANVHDVWARGRIEEGWTYGPIRDGVKKETPCLVPYAELPESEKEYDRSTAMETLKFIIKSGYTISK